MPGGKRKQPASTAAASGNTEEATPGGRKR